MRTTVQVQVFDAESFARRMRRRVPVPELRLQDEEALPMAASRVGAELLTSNETRDLTTNADTNSCLKNLWMFL